MTGERFDKSTASVSSHGPNGEIRNRMKEDDTDLTVTAKAGLGMLVTRQEPRRWKGRCAVNDIVNHRWSVRT